MIFKRHIAVLLVVVLLVGMMPLQIFAAENTEGSWSDPGNYDSNWLSDQINNELHDGSATNPYMIYDNGDLAAFSCAVNNGNDFFGKTIKLNDNLDLSEHFWVPIGFWKKSFEAESFEGTFNGNNKKISGVKMGTASNPDSSTECLGLFGSVVSATVKSLGVGVEIYSSKANATIGGLIGNINTDSIVQNCYTTGIIVSEGGDYVGGFGGHILNYAKIQNSCSSVKVDVTGTYNLGVGGFVGAAFYGEIYNSYSTGAVSAPTISYVGGFSGYNEEENIENCYWRTDNASPAVTSGSAIGITGITGKTELELRSNEFLTLLNENESSVQGLCKWQYDNNSLFLPTTLLTISFNLNGGGGDTPPNIYAELGVNFLFEVPTANIISPEGKIFDCWNTQLDGNGVRFVNEKDDKYYEDVVLYAIYREVTWQDEGNYDTAIYDQLSTLSGWVSAFDNGGILKISTARELAAFAKACDGDSYSEYINGCIASYQDIHGDGILPQGEFLNVKLMNDIDLSEFSWTPIAAYVSSSGATCLTFDGNSKTISDLRIDGQYDSAGLFGGVLLSVIKNLTVSGNINGEYSSAGGIVGTLIYSDVENCISDVDLDVTADNVGGIAGISVYIGIPSRITNSLNKGSIKGSSNVSGICNGDISQMVDLEINNCYNTGTLSVGSYPISNLYTGTNNYYLDTSVTNVPSDSDGIEVTDEYMKSTAFVSDLNNWVDVQNATSPDKYSSWVVATNDYPILEQTEMFDISATVTAFSIADQPVLEADTKITVPIKASFDKDVILTEIEYSISYNNTEFSIDEDDYIGLSPIVTQIGTTSTLKLTKSFANQSVLTGDFETIDFKPIVKPTAMAGEQLITVVPKITIIKDEDTYVLGTTQYPIITVNGTVNLTKSLTNLTDIIIKNGLNTYAITPTFSADEPNYIVMIPRNIETVDISTTKIGDGIITGEGVGISVNSPATVSIHSADSAADKTYTITFINLVVDDKQPLIVHFGEYTLYYDGSPQSRSFTITQDNLMEGVDYTVSYSDMQGRLIDKPSLAGTYQVTITVNADHPNYYGIYQALYIITTPEPATTSSNTDRDSSGSLASILTLETEQFPYINGYLNGTFQPEGYITRAETATIISRLSDGFQEKTIYDCKLTDVNSDLWSVNYIGFSQNKGVIEGYPDGEFKPEDTITRAEFATMISRFKMLKAESKETLPFSDVISHWSINYLSAVYEKGYILGYTNGTFAPDQPITRAEAVTIINRAINRVPNKTNVKIDSYSNPFSDVDKGYWAYYDVLESAIEHFVEDFQ
ncbi:MAG: S-layer homology domain-containing protein [Sedimentibacter sp.]